MAAHGGVEAILLATECRNLIAWHPDRLNATAALNNQLLCDVDTPEPYRPATDRSNATPAHDKIPTG